MIAQYRGKWPIADLCQWASVPKSSLYYKAREGVRGIRPSTHTIVGGFALVENDLVVDQIRAILNNGLLCLWVPENDRRAP
jgi:putative transposase